MGSGFAENPCSQPDAVDTDVVVTGEIQLLCLSAVSLFMTWSYDPIDGVPISTVKHAYLLLQS